MSHKTDVRLILVNLNRASNCMIFFLFLSLMATFSAEWNHLSNFEREQYEEHLSEIMLHLVQRLMMRCCFKF